MTTLSRVDERLVQEQLIAKGYFGEKRSRALVKALVYRIVAVIITTVGIGVITGEWVLSVGASVAINLFKVVIYYLYERAWERMSWGRIKAQEVIGK
ncbi:MAG: DUF2061 domain-containing protein [Candidatus Thorarchaeota archaeon]